MNTQNNEQTAITKEKMEETLSNMNKVAEISQKHVQTKIAANQIVKEREKISKYVDGDLDSIEEKLKKYSTVEELMKAVQTKEQVDEFFVDEESGTVTGIVPVGKEITEEEELEFKKSLLIFMKQTEISNREIQDVFDQFEEERAELEKELHTTISDFIDQYLNYARELRRTTPNTEENKSIIEEIDYVESGFDFRKIIETFEAHPSIPENTIKDMKNQDTIMQLGKRYRTAINNAKSIASLIAFISNSPETSFEEMYLPPDKYKPGYENLFMFSLIRYFAMTYWSKNIKRMHSVIIVTLQKFINDEMAEDVKQEYINNIATYLEKLYSSI